MSKVTEFYYRCRMCGAVYEDTRIWHDFGQTVIYDTIRGRDMDSSIKAVQPRMTEVHNCSENKMGVADFIGVELSEVE